MGKLNVREVEPGDQVVLRHRRNFIEGEAKYDKGQWFVDAFKTKIVFARDKRDGLGKAMVPGVDLAGHTSQLTTGS